MKPKELYMDLKNETRMNGKCKMKKWTRTKKINWENEEWNTKMKERWNEKSEEKMKPEEISIDNKTREMRTEKMKERWLKNDKW
jgi:hypothetical protein